VEKLTFSKIEQYLFKAAWILKGPVDASDFKVYIFPLLFFKRLQMFMTKNINKLWRNLKVRKNMQPNPNFTVSKFRKNATGMIYVKPQSMLDKVLKMRLKIKLLVHNPFKKSLIYQIF
jgi:hypothetical protein